MTPAYEQKDIYQVYKMVPIRRSCVQTHSVSRARMFIRARPALVQSTKRHENANINRIPWLRAWCMTSSTSPKHCAKHASCHLTDRAQQSCVGAQERLEMQSRIRTCAGYSRVRVVQGGTETTQNRTWRQSPTRKERDRRILPILKVSKRTR